jgi:hypothetical protein
MKDYLLSFIKHLTIVLLTAIILGFLLWVLGSFLAWEFLTIPFEQLDYDLVRFSFLGVIICALKLAYNEEYN